MKPVRRLALVALLVATPVAAAEPLALVGSGASGLAGAFRTVYATGLGEGWGEVGFLADYGRAPELFDDTGAERLGYRLTAGVPIWGPVEIGLDLRGVRAATTDMAEDFVFSSFGDIGLAVKGSHALRPDLRVGVAAGYDLLQGVAERSTVGDVATPWASLLVGWFGDVGDSALPLRAHLQAGYRHDRTINFLGAERRPADLERWAWGMFDDVRGELRVAVESPLGALLPVVEYDLEAPLADGLATDRLVHTVTPGLKARVAEGLLLLAAVDLAFGDRMDAGPALMPWTARIGATWRIGGDIPPAVRPDRPARAETPATRPAPVDAAPPVTAPVDSTAPADTTAPAEPPADPTAPTEAAPPREGAVDTESFELR